MAKKVFSVVQKIEKEVRGVQFVKYQKTDLSAGYLEENGYKPGVKKGDRLRVVSGRKVPIGTEGTVQFCSPNFYEGSFNDILTGREIHMNPYIVLELDDGSTVKTYGNNCINLSIEGIDGVHEFKNEKEFDDFKLSEDLEWSKDWWYYDSNAKDICVVGWSLYGLTTKSYGIYKGMIKETEDEVAAVIDDFVHDVYKFVSFSKKTTNGNLLRYVSEGTARNMDDMWRGSTGIVEAEEAFEEFCKKAA